MCQVVYPATSAAAVYVMQLQGLVCIRLQLFHGVISISCQDNEKYKREIENRKILGKLFQTSEL